MDHEDKLSARALAGSSGSPGANPRVGDRAGSSVPPTSSSDSSNESTDERAPSAATPAQKSQASKSKKKPNNVRQIRIERMMSKAELARRANLSVLTIDRVEKGFGCRMDTKRKILEALGLSLADRVRVFGEEE